MSIAFRGMCCAIVSARSYVLCIGLVLAASCSEQQPSPSPPAADAPEPGVIRIRGNERLGWSQLAASLPDVRAHTFVLYVDGAPRLIADVQCADGAAVFSCSGRLPALAPGRHVLELAARWNDMESSRSAPLVVQLVALESAIVPESAGRTAISPVSCSIDACYDVTVVAEAAGAITWPMAAPDGRLFFVDGERLIRVVYGERVLPEPVLTIDDPSGRIVGFALDTQFHRTRVAYVSWTTEGRQGARELRISRFRELQNVFAEGATIVSGIGVPDAVLAPITVGPDQTIYVAVPAPLASAPQHDAYGGLVLRFKPDGAAVSSNTNGSPVVAIGFERPTSIVIAPHGERLWLAGTRVSWPFVVASVPMEPARDSMWPYHPDAAFAAAEYSFDAPFMTFAHDDREGLLLYLVAAPFVFRAEQGLTALTFTGIAAPVALAPALGGDVYLVTQHSAHQNALLRLTRRPR